MHRASCVSLPLRSAKRPLQAYIHNSTDSLRLPRFRTASHIHAHARGRFLAQGHEIKRFQLLRAIPCACDAKTTPGDAAGHTTPHACHAKRQSRTQQHAHNSPRLPRHAKRPRNTPDETLIPTAQRLGDTREGSHAHAGRTGHFCFQDGLLSKTPRFCVFWNASGVKRTLISTEFYLRTVPLVHFRLNETPILEPPQKKCFKKLRLPNIRGNMSPETSPRAASRNHTGTTQLFTRHSYIQCTLTHFTTHAPQMSNLIHVRRHKRS